MTITIKVSRLDADFWHWVLRRADGTVLATGSHSEYEGAKRAAETEKRFFGG